VTVLDAIHGYGADIFVYLAGKNVNSRRVVMGVLRYRQHPRRFSELRWHVQRKDVRGCRRDTHFET